jgi:hypothetical protein
MVVMGRIKTGTCCVTVAFVRHIPSTVIKNDVTKHGAVDLEFHLFLTPELGLIGHLHAPAVLPAA